MKRLILFLFLIASAIYAQVETSGNVGRAMSVVPFSIDYSEYKSGEAQKTRLDIFVQVPYTSIQFVKKNNTFSAGYSVTLTFYDKDKKNILLEKMWKESIQVALFDQTLSRNNSFISYRTFDFQPGSYTIRCTIEDTDSRKSSTQEFSVVLNTISDTLGISGIMLVSEIIKDPAGEKVFPNVAKLVSNQTDSVLLFHEIYSDKERQVYIEYYLEDLKSKVSTKELLPHNLKAGINSVYYSFKYSDFKLGDYIIKAVLKDSEWKEAAATEKRFFSKIYGLPNSITDLNKAVDQMIYICSPSELGYIKDSENYDEKLNRFFAFWNNKKPNPQVDENPILFEYYRRIEFANNNFKGFSEGWRSDMAMIYVTFGPPSHVERHPFDSNSKPYEIWEYFELNRSFVFMDQTGFGDYRLYNPDYSRWPGYRY